MHVSASFNFKYIFMINKENKKGQRHIYSYHGERPRISHVGPDYVVHEKLQLQVRQSHIEVSVLNSCRKMTVTGYA